VDHFSRGGSGAVDFPELLDHRATRYRLARKRETGAVADLSERIRTELEKRFVASYEAQVSQKTKLVADYTADRAKLVSKGSEERVARHTAIASAAEKVRAKVRGYTRQRQTFVALQDEVKDLRQNRAPDFARDASPSSEQWYGRTAVGPRRKGAQPACWGSSEPFAIEARGSRCLRAASFVPRRQTANRSCEVSWYSRLRWIFRNVSTRTGVRLWASRVL